MQRSLRNRNRGMSRSDIRQRSRLYRFLDVVSLVCRDVGRASICTMSKPLQMYRIQRGETLSIGRTALGLLTAWKVQQIGLT